MKLQTIRVRRSRPSAPALALALALTMLCVYLISLSAEPEVQRSDASAAVGEAELRMEGLNVAFVCDALCENLTEARIAAANCTAAGGAGMLLGEDGQFAVVRDAISPNAAPEGALMRSADGLTLRLRGPASEITAISDALSFLRTQAVETSGFATALEAGDTDPNSLSSLLEVYRTQGAHALDALADIQTRSNVVERLQSSVQSEFERLEGAIQDLDAGKIKRIHAAACAEWIKLLDDLSENMLT